MTATHEVSHSRRKGDFFLARQTELQSPPKRTFSAFSVTIMLNKRLSRKVGNEAKPSCLCVAQNGCKHMPVSAFWKRCERRQFILVRAATPKALRRPVAPLCHPFKPPYLIHKHSPPLSPTTNKGLCYQEFS